MDLQFAGEKVRIVAPVVKEKGEGFENGKMLTTLFTPPAVTISQSTLPRDQQKFLPLYYEHPQQLSAKMGLVLFLDA